MLKENISIMEIKLKGMCFAYKSSFIHCPILYKMINANNQSSKQWTRQPDICSFAILYAYLMFVLKDFGKRKTNEWIWYAKKKKKAKPIVFVANNIAQKISQEKACDSTVSSMDTRNSLCKQICEIFIYLFIYFFLFTNTHKYIFLSQEE